MILYNNKKHIKKKCEKVFNICMNKEIAWYKLMTFSSKRSNGPIHRKPEKKKKNILVKMQKNFNRERIAFFCNCK